MSYRTHRRRQSVSLALMVLKGDLQRSELEKYIPDSSLRRSVLQVVDYLTKVKDGKLKKYPMDPLNKFEGFRREVKEWLEHSKQATLEVPRCKNA